jgi:hypothetical protein
MVSMFGGPEYVTRMAMAPAFAGGGDVVEARSVLFGFSVGACVEESEHPASPRASRIPTIGTATILMALPLRAMLASLGSASD